MEAENGGAGVYNVNLKTNYLLSREEWKEDVIPELVDTVRYRKGPYAADVGDFGSAGSAAIDYVRALPQSFAELTAGPYGYRRGLVAGSPAVAGGHLLYALEWTGDNGPWTQPEQLNKLNGLLRYARGDARNGWSVAALAYSAALLGWELRPLEIAGATGSGILKTLGVYLVNHGTLPPRCLVHESCSCFE